MIYSEFLSINPFYEANDKKRLLLVWDTRLRFYEEVKIMNICCNYFQRIVLELDSNDLFLRTKTNVPSKLHKDYHIFLENLPVAIFKNFKSIETLIEEQKYDDALALIRKALEKVHYLFNILNKIEVKDQEFIDKYLFKRLSKFKQSSAIGENLKENNILIGEEAKNALREGFYSKLCKNTHIDIEVLKLFSKEEYFKEKINFFKIYDDFITVFCFCIDILISKYGILKNENSSYYDLYSFMDGYIPTHKKEAEKQSKNKDFNKILYKHKDLSLYVQKLNLIKEKVKELQVKVKEESLLRVKDLSGTVDSLIDTMHQKDNLLKQFINLVRYSEEGLNFIYLYDIMHIYDNFDILHKFYYEFLNIKYQSDKTSYVTNIDEISLLNALDFLENELSKLDKLHEEAEIHKYLYLKNMFKDTPIGDTIKELFKGQEINVKIRFDS